MTGAKAVQAAIDAGRPHAPPCAPCRSDEHKACAGTVRVREETKQCGCIVCGETRDEIVFLDVPVILVRNESMGDWWRIERATHTGDSWSEPVGNARYWCVPARLHKWTCYEGEGHEMIAIAAAIEKGSANDFTRVACETHPDGVDLWSPRNSNGLRVRVPLVRARELAADIRAKVSL